MKGIVFTELLEMVESQFGVAVVDQIIQPDELTSKGVFTSVGTYPYLDFLTILQHLSLKTGLSIPDLEKAFGQYLAGSFTKLYASLFEKFSCTFDLMIHLDSYIHQEVIKLYPDAEMPSFDVVERRETELEMIYRSHRKMFPFAEGLMQATENYYQEEIQLVVLENNFDGAEIRFKLVQN